ncbi:MAG: HyaD/HybD family hydrogenase maturation endopeptidase [Candidatus Omnitrophota bacterium]
MKNYKKITILGIGNLLLQDEGIGIHVINKLKQKKIPDNVEIIDGGTAGFDLLPVIQASHKLIVIDAVKTKDKPGTIYKFSPQSIDIKQDISISLHNIGFMEAVEFCRKQGKLPQTIIFGIVPEKTGLGLELSACLKKKITEIIALVKKEIKLHKAIIYSA